MRWGGRQTDRQDDGGCRVGGGETRDAQKEGELEKEGARAQRWGRGGTPLEGRGP